MKKDAELERIKQRKLIELLKVKNMGKYKKPTRKVHLQIFLLQSSCCPGGVCGPDFEDPTSRLVTLVKEIVAQFNGRVSAEVINILHPMVRTYHKDVIERVREYGFRVVPILKVDGELLVSGIVPEREVVLESIRRRLEGS